MQDSKQEAEKVKPKQKEEKNKEAKKDDESSDKIYVLALEGGFYYVGKSKNPEDRLAAHKAGDGPEWTKLHRPIRMQVIGSCNTIYDELNITLRFMLLRDVQKVRGGPFVNVELTEEEEHVIDQMLCHLKDVCYECKQPGHYASRCPEIPCKICRHNNHAAIKCFAKKDVDGNRI